MLEDVMLPAAEPPDPGDEGLALRGSAEVVARDERVAGFLECVVGFGIRGEEQRAGVLEQQLGPSGVALRPRSRAVP